MTRIQDELEDLRPILRYINHSFKVDEGDAYEKVMDWLTSVVSGMPSTVLIVYGKAATGKSLFTSWFVNNVMERGTVQFIRSLSLDPQIRPNAKLCVMEGPETICGILSANDSRHRNIPYLLVTHQRPKDLEYERDMTVVEMVRDHSTDATKLLTSEMGERFRNWLLKRAGK